MKEPKRGMLGLLAVVVLLLAYGIFTTARISRLERRLNRVDGAYKQLEARHHAFVVTVSNAILQADVSPEVLVHAQAETLRESLGVPPTTVVQMRPAGVEVNSLPRVTIK